MTVTPPAPLVAELSPTTERTLVWLGGGELWLEVGVWVLSALVVGLTIYNHRRLQPIRRRVGMIALRTTLIGLMLALFYQPGFLEEKVAFNRNTVVVMVDGSESMALPHAGSTRIKLTRDFLAKQADRWRRLAEVHDLAFVLFGEGVSDLPDGATEPYKLTSEITATAQQTQLVAALAEVQERYRNQDIGGVVIISDGIDTSAAGQRANLGQDTKNLLRDIDAPVSSFTTAADPGIKDVSISHLGYNNFAFLLNATSLEATIRVHGFMQGQLRVELTENGREIATQYISVSPLQKDYRVKFDFVPKKLGKQVFGVQVAPQPGEIYAKNNRKHVIINVVRDKIRVVQIVGQPSWDERYLRNHLKENPNVDLVSFFILVNRHNRRPLSSAETSLIPFPARELFEQELGGFDLLIFQNFNYGPFSTRRYLPNIAQFVRDGGAFAMVGGPLSLTAGGYYGTPITDILPVEIPPGIGDETSTETGEMVGVLTDAGHFHPITRLAVDPATNRAIWKNMEPLEGLNLTTRTRKDALTLLAHPSLKDADGEPQPIVAVREVEQGRSMVVTTDSTWNWAFKAGQSGKDTHRYDAFWSNAIRWLIKDPELDLVKVHVARETVPVGDTASATVTVFGPDYRPAARQDVTVTVSTRGPGDGAGQGSEVLRLDDATTDADGELRVEIPVKRAGIYEIEARARVVSDRTASGSDLFVGSDTNAEFDQVIGDDRLLGNLAEASQGRVFPLEIGAGEDLPLKRPREIRVKSRRHAEIWNSGWTLLLLAALFGLEWWLRRRLGYL